MILSQSETLGEAKVLDGLERWHHDILQLICLEGEAELRELPLRHFAPLFICASSLPQEAQIWMPPTVRMPMHNTITAPELQNLLKYSSNFPAYFIFHCPTMQFQLKVYISFWFWHRFSAKLISWNWEVFHLILQILFVNTIFSVPNLWSLIWPTLETLFFYYIYPV